VPHGGDLRDGFGWVWLPFSLARKYMSHAVFFAPSAQWICYMAALT
jgi:hypothetical protein